MSEAEVRAQAEDEFAESLQTKLDAAVERDDLIGANESADEIKYDLELPESVDGLNITWSSSNPDVIADDGTVVSPAEETDVTLTGNVAYGVLSAEVSFTYTVIPLDREALDALIEEAEAIDTAYLSDLSKTRLETAIEAAKDADSYTKAEKAESDLRFIMDNLEYKDEAVNPFAHIAEPVYQATLEAGETQELLQIPEEIAEYVTVEYTSENSDVAVYEDGTVTAAAAGKTIVTAKVTANYDGFVMEYSTAVEVEGESVQTPTLEKIQLSGNVKKDYTLGEELDLSDLVVTAVYSDGTETTVPAGDYTVEGYDANTPGEQTIIVRYGGQTAEFTVAVTEKEDPEQPGTDEPGTEQPGTDKPGTDVPGGEDQKPSGTNDPSSSTQGGNNQSQTGDDPDKAVQTGDTTNVLPIAAACILAFAAAGKITAVKVKKKKK